MSQPLPGQGDVMLLHLDSGACYRLNGVGARLWELAADPVEIAALRARLAAECADAPESLSTDVHHFLQSLAERGLIEVGSVPPAPA